MKYCEHCGKQLFDEAVICMGCGCPTEPLATDKSPKTSHLLQTLSEKIKTEAVIWIVIASIQVLIGLSSLAGFGSDMGIIILVISALNFVTAYNDMNYAKEVLVAPKNIVAKFEPMASLVVMLVYNIIFGGVIGVVGIIFGFVTRDYVMKNKTEFQAYDEHPVK